MIKIGDRVRYNKHGKTLNGMKLLKISDSYGVVDNTTDIGDGVISLDELEIDIDWYRRKKLKKILK